MAAKWAGGSMYRKVRLERDGGKNSGVAIRGVGGVCGRAPLNTRFHKLRAAGGGKRVGSGVGS